MAQETTTTTVTEVIERNAYAASVLYFSEKLGLSDFVSKIDLTGRSTLTAYFPIYDKVSAEAIAENTDYTTNQQIDTTGSCTVTVSEHIFKATITDLSLDATVDDLSGSEGSVPGRMAAETLQRRQDQDISALFAGFNSSTGSNSGAITTTLLIDGIAQLDIDNVPRDMRVTVLHPFQWKTLLPSFDDAAVYGPQGQTVVTTGLLGSIYGSEVFVTSNVATATVSSSTVYAGAVMHPSAVALATKGEMPKMAVERDESLRAFELVATGVWGEAEYRGGATTSGRGGAGVYLYSNSTV